MEIDAYCFSTLATKYAGKTDTTEIVAGNPGANQKQPVDALNDALQWFDEHEVAPENQIIFASPKFLKMLRSTGELYKRLDQAEYKKNVSFLIEEYEGRPIVMVAPNRFKTDILLGDFGYSFGALAKDINFMVVAKDAVYHVVKYNKVRVFAPEVVQDYDGYKVNARVYHDVFVPDNKRAAVYVSVAYGDAKPGLATECDMDIKTVAGATSGDTSVAEVNVINNRDFIAGLYYKVKATATRVAEAAGVALTKSNFTAITALPVSIDMDSKTNLEIVAIDAAGRVIASKTITPEVAA